MSETLRLDSSESSSDKKSSKKESSGNKAAETAARTNAASGAEARPTISPFDALMQRVFRPEAPAKVESDEKKAGTGDDKGKPEAAETAEADDEATLPAEQIADPTEVGVEAPLDELEAVEETQAGKAYVQDHKAAIQAEAAAASSAEAGEAAQSADSYLDRVDGKLNEGKTVEQAANEAYVEETGLPLPEDQPAEADEAATPEAATAETTGPAMGYEDLHPEEDETTLPPVAGAAYTAGTPGVAAGGGRGVPPPYGVGYAGGPGAGGPGGYNPNAFPGAGGGWVSAAEARGREAQAAVGAGLLIGTLAYFLGRRRGRIRTEQQLIPIQKKLERQVQALHDHIALREAQVRQVVWERAAERKAATVPSAETAKSVTYQAPLETTASYRAERPVAAPAERFSSTKLPEAAKPVPKTAETMDHDEVLKISETIAIGSQTMRQVYESNLISKRGLERIVDAHLQGGNVRRVFIEELFIRDISHELDPVFRDRPVSEVAPGAGGGQTGAVPTTANAGQPSAPRVTSASQREDSWYPGEDRPRLSSILVTANVVALAVLGVLVAILFIVWLTHL